MVTAGSVVVLGADPSSKSLADQFAMASGRHTIERQVSTCRTSVGTVHSMKEPPE